MNPLNDTEFVATDSLKTGETLFAEMKAALALVLECNADHRCLSSEQLKSPIVGVNLIP